MLPQVIYTLVVILQTALHYLGWLGVILGVIALIFGNTQRGTELLTGGFSFIALKYIIGLLFRLFARATGPK